MSEDLNTDYMNQFNVVKDKTGQLSRISSNGKSNYNLEINSIHSQENTKLAINKETLVSNGSQNKSSLFNKYKTITAKSDHSNNELRSGNSSKLINLNNS